jgi:hypothetical protein
LLPAPQDRVPPGSFLPPPDDPLPGGQIKGTLRVSLGDRCATPDMPFRSRRNLPQNVPLSDAYLGANVGRIPNYGERAGEVISAAFTESAVNQLAGDFHRWYPGFNQAPDPVALAP